MPPKMPPRFSINTDLTLCVNAPLKYSIGSRRVLDDYLSLQIITGSPFFNI